MPTITRLDRRNLRWSFESAQGQGHPAKTKRRLKANLRAAERQDNSILIAQLVATWPPPTKVNPASAAPYTPAMSCRPVQIRSGTDKISTSEAEIAARRQR